MFHHFDFMFHREYLLFLCHAAVISGAFWGLTHTNGLRLIGPAGQENTAKLHDIIIMIILLLLLLHVKVVFYCTSAPVNKHLN